MKNFFKKLSFVLAIAMVLTSIAPATASAAEVVPAKKVNVKTVAGEKITSVELDVEETETIKIGLPVKKAYAGLKSTFKTWAVAADETVVDVVREGNRTYTLTGVAAGETTITITAAKTRKLAKAGEGVKATLNVVVNDSFAITNLEATKVNVLTATFSGAVDTDNVTLAVVKGANTVDHKVEWNATKTVATITTTAKLIEGTYTVKATAKDATTEKSVDIVSQYVAAIEILNDVALTGKVGTMDAAEVYVYYKVVDQYGEDLTASTSIDWNTSCGKPVVKRNEGKLIVSRSDAKAFTYGEQLFVSGVYKTGVNVNATLTVGSAQALDQIEMVGFVKKNTNKIVETLPNGFKSGEYYLVYLAVDKNGNALEVTGAHTTDDVNFVSDNILLVREIKHASYPVVIDGVSYFAAEVVPGDYVSKGGEVNITAIASKTGTPTKHNYVVGQNQILTSFTMSDPTSLIADGEKVAIPFTALDQNGEAITNFTTLADNLNDLTFSVSDGTVVLKEEKDGTASLTYFDSAMAWSDSQSTDGIDRKVSITSVVVGGNSDNLMIDICDKARPDAIKNVAVDAVVLEGATKTMALKDFLFLDQYGRVIGVPSYMGIVEQDNGFFAASANGEIHGIDFANYTYNIVMEYKGNVDALTTAGAINATTNSAIVLGTTTDFEVAAKTKTALSGNVFTFTIAKKHADKTEYENVSTTLNKSFTVVDITQVKNFAISALNKQLIQTNASASLTGRDFGLVSDAESTGTKITANVTLASTVVPTTHEQKIVVTGTYNGATVAVPESYFVANGVKLIVDPATYKINSADASAIAWSDLYDATTANYLRKDTTDVIKATIYEIYNATGEAITGDKPVRDTASVTVSISDAAPTLAMINVADACDITPTDTATSSVGVMAVLEAMNQTMTYLDQYGKKITPAAVTYKISQIEEATAYADNNFLVSGNDSPTVNVEGAERGDVFVFTITASHGTVTLTKNVTVTVGADTNAKLTEDQNFYTDGKINIGAENDLKDYLEGQRVNGLK